MSEQQFQGTLASGGTFIATGQGIRILDPAGNQLANFGREVISGVRRDGQVVTIERHQDTIVTLTAASITDAVGLEQYVRDTVVAPPVIDEPAAGAGSLAFDAFDEDTEPPAPEPPAPAQREPERPQIISRPDPSTDEEPERPRHDLPEPVPTTPPPPRSDTYPPVSQTPETLPGEPRAPIPPPPPPGRPAAVVGEPPPEEGGRRLWLWGCLGCGGLLILIAVCVGVLLATGAIDTDDFTEDDATSTPFIIIATSDDADPTATGDTSGSVEPTPTEAAGEDEPTPSPVAGGDEATPTDAGTGAEPTATTDAGGESPTSAPTGDTLNAGESGTLNGVVVTYLSSRTDSGGIFPPDAGNIYLILRFQVENTNADPFPMSTLLQYELTDQSGEVYGIALFAETEGGLDTEIPPGETIEGEVAFEVSEGSGPYVVSYEDLLSDTPILWTVE
ncbi:MAG: DUF4352 domain-containing protein [Thermomicrobiales bacterium]